MIIKAAQIPTFPVKEKPYKVYDTKGLYLLIHPNGSRYWRMRYFVDGKEKLMSLGVWPKVGIALARRRRNEVLKAIYSEKLPRQFARLTRKAEE